MSEFFQEAPGLKNQYTEDRLLQAYLHWRIPAMVVSNMTAHLTHLGQRAATDMLAWADEAEKNPPKHIPYDPWGKRIDHIETCNGWKQLEGVAAEEGLIAAGYERKFDEYSRIYQMALLYLYHPSSAIYSCPLAMTDGATRAIELYGDDYLKNKAYRHLTSRDPKNFWTSGQWMTERTGGSDVSGTSTIAKKVGDHYELHGTKWFTSATTSQMAMTLARIEGADKGSRGLSLFYLELRNDKNELNKIMVHRLKDKLGTKSLPTAELSLQGTPARLVGGEGGGVKKIASLFNITRVYNSVCALSHMRRGLALAKDYSQKREAFGRKIIDHPLHVETMMDLYVDYAASFHLVMRAVELLGKEECGKATEEESALLRLLTPVIKLFSAKKCMSVTSEVMEVFGGAGYVEDTGMPRMLRDAQVFPIWEGTTNVLSLDILRAIEKENAFKPFMKELGHRLQGIMKEPMAGQQLKGEVQAIEKSLKDLESYFHKIASGGTGGLEDLQTSARYFAFSVGNIFAATLMTEFALHTKDLRDIETARRWCTRNTLFEVPETSQSHRFSNAEIIKGL
ncbi:acyl-CoA dehydrogenase family protein [Bdellovibrio sp. HCB337]|uniref:acyl-CoA dehydrogenase family protein n=1 Tax=Bdellovibrio sp. HCB337 TaxID=3394358 RepID=UPI0039A5587C